LALLGNVDNTGSSSPVVVTGHLGAKAYLLGPVSVAHWYDSPVTLSGDGQN